MFSNNQFLADEWHLFQPMFIWPIVRSMKSSSYSRSSNSLATFFPPCAIYINNVQRIKHAACSVRLLTKLLTLKVRFLQIYCAPQFRPVEKRAFLSRIYQPIGLTVIVVQAERSHFPNRRIAAGYSKQRRLTGTSKYREQKKIY